MRRLAVCVISVGLILISSWPATARSEESYRDDFKKASYAGNDGSLEWAGSWSEIGENDGPDTGAVHVMDDQRCSGNKCLHIHSAGAILAEVGAKRFADTSIFAQAELCYELNAVILDTVELGDTNLYVEVTKDGGSSWSTVDTLSVTELFDTRKKRTIALEGYLSEGFGLRFVVNGLLDGEVFVDNVEVWGVLEEGTTTTSTSTTTTAPTTTTTKPIPGTTAPGRVTQTEGADGGVGPTSTTAITRTSPDRENDVDEQGGTPIDAQSPSGGDGLHYSKMGVQADYVAPMSDDEALPTPQVLGLTVEYGMAVEAIAANWLWPVLLVLLVSMLLVVGIDRRRRLTRPG